MTGFKLRTSGIGSDHSANWATTTAIFDIFGYIMNLNCEFIKLFCPVSSAAIEDNMCYLPILNV